LLFVTNRPDGQPFCTGPSGTYVSCNVQVSEIFSKCDENDSS